jgi:hypothetical protein
MPLDDDPTVPWPWLAQMLAEARQEGLRLDEPKGQRAFMARVARGIAAQAAGRSGPDPDGLEPWQRDGTARLWGMVMALVEACFPKPPESALLVTFFDETAAPVTIALDEAVEVRVTLADGSTKTVRPTEVLAVGGWPAIERVEPVQLHLGFLFWCGHWSGSSSSATTTLPVPVHIVRAWDLRGPLLSVPDEHIARLLAGLRRVGAGAQRHSPGWHARQDRETTLWQMDRADQLAVTRQAVEDELVGDGEHRRIPLSGLLQPGAPARFDAGGAGAPISALQRVSDLLRAERRAQEVEEFDDEEHAASPAEAAVLWSLICDLTARLRGKERAAVRHYLRATLIERDEFTRYCARNKLPYESTSRNFRRGLDRLAPLRT